MAEVISKSICLIHPGRAASARCPECRRFFCGECITEHDGRLTCAQCLLDEGSKIGGQEQESKWRIGAAVFPVLQFALAMLLIWILFYFLARGLMVVPASFHDGTVWE